MKVIVWFLLYLVYFFYRSFLLDGNSTKGGVFGKVKETFTYTELTPAILPVVPLGHSAADVVENAITESNLTQPIGVTETEIGHFVMFWKFYKNWLLLNVDEAMQSVLDHIGQLRQKEFQETLDLDIVERM